MKTVFIEFLIKNTIEPIGLALIEPEMPLSSLVIKFFGKIAYFLKKRKRKIAKHKRDKRRRVYLQGPGG